MEVTVSCPHCGRSVTLAEQYLGTASRCPHADCGQRFVPDKAMERGLEPAAVGVGAGALETGLHFGDNGSGSRPGLSGLAAAIGGSAEPGGIDIAAVPPRSVSAPVTSAPVSSAKSKAPVSGAKPSIRKSAERPMAIPLLAGAIVAVLVGPLVGLLRYSIPLPLVLSLAAGFVIGVTIAVMSGSRTGKVSWGLLVQCVTIGAATGLMAWLVQYWAVKRNLSEYFRKMPVTADIPELETRFNNSFSFERFLKLRAARRFHYESKPLDDQFPNPDPPLAARVSEALTGSNVRIQPFHTSLDVRREAAENPPAVRANGRRIVLAGAVDSNDIREKAIKAASGIDGVSEVDARNLTDETGAMCWELTWSILLAHGGAEFKNFQRSEAFKSEYTGGNDQFLQWTADCFQHKIRGSWRFQAGPLEPSGPFFYAVFFMEIALAAIAAAIVYAHFVARAAEPGGESAPKAAAA